MAVHMEKTWAKTKIEKFRLYIKRIVLLRQNENRRRLAMFFLISSSLSTSEILPNCKIELLRASPAISLSDLILQYTAMHDAQIGTKYSFTRSDKGCRETCIGKTKSYQIGMFLGVKSNHYNINIIKEWKKTKLFPLKIQKLVKSRNFRSIMVIH